MDRIYFVFLASGLLLATSTVADDGDSFFDDFSRSLDARWRISDNWNNGPHQNCQWSKHSVTAEKDALRISFKANPSGDRSYVCGEIASIKSYGYGVYEAVFKTPSGSGLNAAFFTYSGPTLGTPHDEIDVEVLLKDTSKTSVDYHVSGKDMGSENVPLPAASDKNFIHYAFDWDPSYIRWYVNGELVKEITSGPMPTHPQKILFSLWGSETLAQWMGKFAAPEADQEMQIKWVAYTKKGVGCQFPQSLLCKR